MMRDEIRGYDTAAEDDAEPLVGCSYDYGNGVTCAHAGFEYEILHWTFDKDFTQTFVDLCEMHADEAEHYLIDRSMFIDMRKMR